MYFCDWYWLYGVSMCVLEWKISSQSFLYCYVKDDWKIVSFTSNQLCELGNENRESFERLSCYLIFICLIILLSVCGIAMFFYWFFVASPKFSICISCLILQGSHFRFPMRNFTLLTQITKYRFQSKYRFRF
jgi:hypothetical protein